MALIRYWKLNPDHSVEPAPLGPDGHPTTEYLDWCYDDKPTRIVEQTTINDRQWVSTVFLGLDHGFGGGPPVLFETMVFIEGEGGDMWRYQTWDEAVEGHRKACASLQSGLSREELETAKALIVPLLEDDS